MKNLQFSLSAFLGIISAFLPFATSAQSSFAPLNEDYYHWVDRYEIKTGRLRPEIFTSVKPYKRSAIIEFVDSVNSAEIFESGVDVFNRSYLQNDSWEWSVDSESDSERPILRHFYKKKSDFYSVHTSEFDLHVNPVIFVGFGDDSRRAEKLFVNTRGVEVRGMVDQKVGFYTYLTDNQALLPSYVEDYVGQFNVIPHEGFWKRYKEGSGVDFLQARGYITFEATKHINLQFGHDRVFIGNGYRSLIYSDFAPPSLFLKTNVKIWKLNYLFMVNQMVADRKFIPGMGTYPNKFSAFHHLSLNIGKKFNLGIFESVVFSADDTLGASRFRLDYLNPIIFYRAIEQQNASSDNVMLGLDFKWNLVRNLSLYGQFVLDEFVIDNIRAQNGWWANKFAIQAGGKYIDAFGISNLDLQGEINVVRPYTYSHFTNFGNYSSFRQSMAHPLGANFKEVIGILRYQPIPRLNMIGKLSMAEVGRDSVSGKSYGGNILKNNSDRAKEFGNTIGQGVKNTILFGSFTTSFQLKHNFFVDASVIIRKSESALAIYNTNTTAMSLAVRWNIPQRLYEF